VTLSPHLRPLALTVLILGAASALAVAVGGLRGLAAATAAVVRGSAVTAAAAHDRGLSAEEAGEPVGELRESRRVKRFGDEQGGAERERALAVRGGLRGRHDRGRDLR
jgi:hypothetical protein